MTMHRLLRSRCLSTQVSANAPPIASRLPTPAMRPQTPTLLTHRNYHKRNNSREDHAEMREWLEDIFNMKPKPFEPLGPININVYDLVSFTKRFKDPPLNLINNKIYELVLSAKQVQNPPSTWMSFLSGSALTAESDRLALFTVLGSASDALNTIMDLFSKPDRNGPEMARVKLYNAVAMLVTLLTGDELRRGKGRGWHLLDNDRELLKRLVNELRPWIRERRIPTRYNGGLIDTLEILRRPEKAAGRSDGLEANNKRLNKLLLTKRKEAVNLHIRRRKKLIETIKAHNDRLEEMRDIQTRLTSIEHEKDSLKVELDDTRKRLEEVTEQRNTLLEAKEEHRNNPLEPIFIVQQQVQDLESELMRLREELNDVNDEYNALLEANAFYQCKADHYCNDNRDLQACYEVAIKQLHDSNMKSQNLEKELQTIRKALQDAQDEQGAVTENQHKLVGSIAGWERSLNHICKECRDMRASSELVIAQLQTKYPELEYLKGSTEEDRAHVHESNQPATNSASQHPKAK